MDRAAAQNLFNMRVMKKEWSLIPTVAICGGAVVMCAGYIAYMCTTKPDISFRPWSWGKDQAPYQGVKPNEVRKFVQPNNLLPADVDIENLKRELGSFKA